MGIRHGLIVCRGSIEQLRSVCAARNAKLELTAQTAGLEELPTDDDDVFAAAIRSEGSVVAVFDGSMILGSDIDFVSELAMATRATAIGCVAESVSGTYGLVAASPDGVLRAYWHCHSAQRLAWEHGLHLASERSWPLDGNPSGVGLLKAIESVGFPDLTPWLERTWEFATLDFDFEAPDPPKSALAKACEAFVAQQKQQLEGTPEKQPQVVLRSNGERRDPDPTSGSTLSRMLRKLFGR